MWCVRSFTLGMILTLVFAGDANAQPATTDPTLVTIDSGAIRGVAAVVRSSVSRASPMPSLRSVPCAGGRRSL